MLLRMLGRKCTVTEDVREEKQSDRGCLAGNAKLHRMTERKRKVTEGVLEEEQCYRG